MKNEENSSFEKITATNSQKPITDIYQSIEQLSLPEKAALAQHLINTNELSVVVNGTTTVNAAVQTMDRVQLGNTLESIAEQIRRLHPCPD